MIKVTEAPPTEMPWIFSLIELFTGILIIESREFSDIYYGTISGDHAVHCGVFMMIMGLYLSVSFLRNFPIKKIFSYPVILQLILIIILGACPVTLKVFFEKNYFILIPIIISMPLYFIMGHIFYLYMIRHNNE